MLCVGGVIRRRHVILIDIGEGGGGRLRSLIGVGGGEVQDWGRAHGAIPRPTEPPLGPRGGRVGGSKAAAQLL